MPHNMIKYHSLGELLSDYRKHRALTQIDLAAMLDVDVRTVIRWEKNESLIKADKEKVLIENMGIPHQVIRNLNSEQAIPVYFDFKRWLYSLTLLSSVVKNAKEFKTDEELHTTRIEPLTNEKDFDFITYIQKNQKNCTPLLSDVIKTAARLLPELNFVIRDQSGYHGGHVSILPLKYDSYQKIANQQMLENELTVNDLSRYNDEEIPVYYFYSIYSNSLDNTYYLINKMLFYFKKRDELQNYIFAGVTFQKLKVKHFQQMGFEVIWEKNVDDHPNHIATFLSGNFNQFFSNETDCF